MAVKNKIPKRTQRLFWDAKKEKVDTKLHRRYIITRVMDHGDAEDVRWMLEAFSREEITEVLKKRRGLSRKSAFFWSTYFDIPREEIECLKTPYRRKQGIS